MSRRPKLVGVAASKMNIIAHGNSLVEGTGASNGAIRGPNAWPAKLAGEIGFTVLNMGVGGRTIAEMTAALATDIYPNLVQNKLNVILPWEFVNSIRLNGYNGVSAHNDYVTYCNTLRAYCKANGYPLYIIAVGLTPVGPLNGVRMPATIVASNLLKANWPKYADQFLDLSLYEPFKTMYANGDWSDAAFAVQPYYTRSDGVARDNVHFSDGFYAFMGRVMSYALRRVRVKA